MRRGNFAVENNRPRIRGGTYKKTWRRLFTKLFVPLFIRRIYNDIVALKATYRDAKAVYKGCKKVTLKSLHFSRVDVAFTPKSLKKKNESFLRPFFGSRIGNLHSDDEELVKRTNSLGENLYLKAAEARLKTVAALKGSKYSYTPYIVLTIWMLRHIVFVRHFRGEFRNYVRLIPCHIYNDIIEFINRIFGSDRFQSFYTFLLAFLLLLSNLLLIGPVYRRIKSFFIYYFPSLRKFRLRKVLLFPFKILGFFTLRPFKALLRYIGRPRSYKKKDFPFLRFSWSLFYFIFFFLVRGLSFAWRVSRLGLGLLLRSFARIFAVFGLLLSYPLNFLLKPFIPSFLPFFVRAFIILGHTGLILFYFIRKIFGPLIPQHIKNFSLKRWFSINVVEPLETLLPYVPFVIFYRVRALSYAILVFKARLPLNLIAHCYRYHEPRVKLNPIRRMQLKYNKFKYFFSRYQLENILHIALVYLFTIPLFFYNKVYKLIGNTQFFHRTFWRGFLAERFPLFFSRWTTKKERRRHFSVLSQQDDLSLTNFFSFDTSFRKNRYLMFEMQDWELSEPFEEFEQRYRDFIVILRRKRTKVRRSVLFLMEVLRRLPPRLFQFLFGNVTFVNTFSNVLLWPAKLWDFSVPFFSLILYCVYLCFAYPFYLLVYLWNKLLNFKEVLFINLFRFDTYKFFGFLRFLFLLVVALFLLLEFFYFFGWYILYVQNFAMKWFDSYLYNWVFFILFSHFLLSYTSPFFANLWREAKYYFLVYPMVIQSWLIWWMLKHELMKKYMAYGFIAKTTKQSWLMDDYLKATLIYMYTSMSPATAYVKFSSKRPYEASELDASQFLFDYVTSLFS